MIDPKTFYKQLGLNTGLKEYGINSSTFVKAANVVSRLESAEGGDSVWRMAAGQVREMLNSSPRTRNKTASFIMDEISKTENLLPVHRKIVSAAFEPLPLEKRAFGASDGLDITPGLLSILIAAGGLGGGVMHYGGKMVDEDHIDIEKNQARKNEYLRLVDELDRKITLRTQKERERAGETDEDDD